MKHIRRWIYKHGYRPKPGSILYSPSLELVYSLQKVDWTAGFEEK